MRTDRVSSFELLPLEGVNLPAFGSGPDITVNLHAGLVRQYWLGKAPHERRATVLACCGPASRGGSGAMHDAVEAGDTITISVPKNHFSLASLTWR